MPIENIPHIQTGFTDENGFRYVENDTKDNYYADLMDNSRVERSEKIKKTKKGFIRYGGIIVSLIITILGTFLLSNDFKMTFNADNLINQGVTCAILIFLGGAILTNCYDSGKRSGMDTTRHIECEARYAQLRDKIYAKKTQLRAYEFCKWYVATELRGAREAILLEASVTYSVYESKYVGKKDTDIDQDTSLSNIRKKAIKKANYLKPIILTPEMFLKYGRKEGSRRPIGLNPQEAGTIRIAQRIILSTAISLLIGSIGFDIITDWSLETLANVALQLCYFVNAGFNGYRIGFETMTEEDVEYKNSMSEMLEKMIEYTDKYEEPKDGYTDPVLRDEDQKIMQPEMQYIAQSEMKYIAKPENKQVTKKVTNE